ncbi:imelysin family protein [Sedimentimonas flavescens]|uniref:Imelysin family protein n=1 Tax=Sedimentimonas flavescens TaxID=2851012 RepID=A0ABT3A0A2_9RHOB|nr:imelysin family protein [Sedimentimonas flavescens]MCV2879439.1 imelysin family protein [Sedimentimonas flavescens]
MRLPAVAALLALASPAVADVPEAIGNHVLPGYAAFTKATADLAVAAQKDCAAEGLRDEWNAAFDAWLMVAHLRMGPAEEQGRALAIAYWPDPKDIGGRQLEAMLTKADPALLTPEGMAQASVAARGLFGLERLIYGEGAQISDTYACDLRKALAQDLAAMAATTEAGWTGGYADLVLSAGAEGNASFLTASEGRQALFTQLITGLEFDADTRIGRPLGTFDKPRPERAEALASGRSLRNVTLSLTALRALAEALAQGLGEIPQTEAAFGRALDLAGQLDDPTFTGVADPSGRLKVEILQQAIQATRTAAEAEIGALLGVSVGFNSADGD